MNLDNEADWQAVLLWAVALGLAHERDGARLLTTSKLERAMGFRFPGTRYRRGHARLLRAAYGAARGGREVTRRGLELERKAKP